MLGALNYRSNTAHPLRQKLQIFSIMAPAACPMPLATWRTLPRGLIGPDEASRYRKSVGSRSALRAGDFGKHFWRLQYMKSSPRYSKQLPAPCGMLARARLARARFAGTALPHPCQPAIMISALNYKPGQ